MPSASESGIPVPLWPRWSAGAGERAPCSGPDCFVRWPPGARSSTGSPASSPSEEAYRSGRIARSQADIPLSDAVLTDTAGLRCIGLAASGGTGGDERTSRGTGATRTIREVRDTLPGTPRRRWSDAGSSCSLPSKWSLNSSKISILTMTPAAWKSQSAIAPPVPVREYPESLRQRKLSVLGAQRSFVTNLEDNIALTRFFMTLIKETVLPKGHCVPPKVIGRTHSPRRTVARTSKWTTLASTPLSQPPATSSSAFSARAFATAPLKWAARPFSSAKRSKMAKRPA